MYFTPAPETAELRQTYFRIRGELVRFARSRAGDDAEAEDIVQDVWLKLETRAPTPVANPRSYLFEMANNIALDRQRERRRRQLRDHHWQSDAALPDTACPHGRDIEARMIERQEAHRLHHAIATLPKGARTVLMLHKIEELSHSEVADRLAISRSGVEKHMAVAMRHLRTALAA